MLRDESFAHHSIGQAARRGALLLVPLVLVQRVGQPVDQLVRRRERQCSVQYAADLVSSDYCFCRCEFVAFLCSRTYASRREVKDVVIDNQRYQ